MILFIPAIRVIRVLFWVCFWTVLLSGPAMCDSGIERHDCISELEQGTIN